MPCGPFNASLGDASVHLQLHDTYHLGILGVHIPYLAAVTSALVPSLVFHDCGCGRVGQVEVGLMKPHADRRRFRVLTCAAMAPVSLPWLPF